MPYISHAHKFLEKTKEKGEKGERVRGRKERERENGKHRR